MYYVIQENTFKEENYYNLVETLDRMNLSYEIVKVLPFVEDFEFKTDRKDVFCLGSVKMARLAKKYEWFPGSQLNENHDYRVYSKYYKDNLLNYDSVVQKFGDDINRTDLFFARPCEDTKTFTGKVFDMYEWLEFRDGCLNGEYETSLTKDTEIQVCSVKKITKEFRFWVVEDKVVTGSLYRMGNFINRSEVVDDGALEFCKEMIDIYKIAKSFVIDICEVIIDGKPEYKIIELGCINSAGFYSANMQKMINALEEEFDNKIIV